MVLEVQEMLIFLDMKGTLNYKLGLESKHAKEYIHEEQTSS